MWARTTQDVVESQVGTSGSQGQNTAAEANDGCLLHVTGLEMGVLLMEAGCVEIYLEFVGIAEAVRLAGIESDVLTGRVAWSGAAR